MPARTAGNHSGLFFAHLMTIDFHSHDFPVFIAARAMAGMCKVTEGRLWSVGDGTLVNHLDQMELTGVDVSVSCPIATRPRQAEAILASALAIKRGDLGARAQRMIEPFVSVHPQDPEAGEWLEKAAAAGVKGVKFHPYYQRFSLADPEVWPLFGRIADLGLIVECHCGADVGFPEITGLCGPEETVTLLKHVRGLTFVAAHMGGCMGYPSHATDGLLECGAYIDTSVLHRDWHRDEPMRLLRSWPRDRILFATDFPWVNPAEAIRWVRTFRAPEDLPFLLGENARRLLKC